MDGSEVDKKNYLEMFSNKFYTALVNMIDKGISFNRSLSEDEVYMEALQHLHMAKDRCELFHGRKDILYVIRDNVRKGDGVPVIAVGSSGCGKTSVMSKCAMLIPEWGPANAKPVVLLRLLGTTPSSTGVYQLIVSLCKQIASCYDIKDILLPEDVSGLIREFHELLGHATSEKPLYLLLDSLDQLSPKGNAFKLNWLPRQLPKNVTLILSTLPDRHGIMETLKKRYSSGRYVEIPSLGGETSKEVLKSWLGSKNRELTKEQLSVIENAFDNCSLALYVKLMTDRVLSWTSYLDVSTTRLPTTIVESINQLFDNLKPKFGETFVMHALGYLTASKSGLSETEIEDLLSLDDVVLTDVFQYHVPPVRRIPQLLWLRLKSEIASYLVNREADGTRVIFWYHRQFIEAAKAYFLKSEEHCTYLHKIMAEYFCGEWHGKPKEFKYNDYQMKKLGLESPDSKADRRVAPQPLVFELADETQNESDCPKQYNYRKLVNVPYHLQHAAAKMESDLLLRTECLYNLEWLQTKVEACSTQAVLYDFDLLHFPSECDDWLKNVLRMRKTTLNQSPRTLPTEIAGTLLPVASVKPYLKKLVEDCYQIGVQGNALLPRLLCYQMPGGALKHELEHPLLPEKKKMLVLTKNPVVLASLTKDTNTLVIWDIEGGDVLEEIKLWPQTEPKFNVLATNTTGDKIICGCAYHTTENPIAVYDVLTEELIMSTKLEKNYSKIGFIDSYQIGLMDDKIFVNVVGREADCFDLQGKHLYSFDVQALNMHLYHEPEGNRREVAFTLKDDVEILWFDATQTKKTLTSSVTMPDVPYKVAFGDSGKDVFVIYKNEEKVLWFQRPSDDEKQEHWDLKSTIDLKDEFSFYTLGAPEEIFSTGPYIILTAGEGVSLWKYAKQRLIHEFRIPDKVKPDDEKVSSFTSHVTSDRRLFLCAYDRYIVIWDLLHGRHRLSLRASMVPISDLLVGKAGGSHSADVLITATSRYRTIKVWDSSLADAENYKPLMLNAACRYSMMGDNSDRMVVRSQKATEVNVIDVVQGKFISQPFKDFACTEPVISADGKYVVGMDYETAPKVRIFDADNGSLCSELPLETIYLKRYAISHNAKYIVTHAEAAYNEGVETTLWDLKTGKLVRKIKAAEGGISQMFFMDNDKLFVTMQMFPFIQKDENAVLHVYSVRSGKEAVTVPNLLASTTFPVPIPHSNYVMLGMAEGSNDQTMRIAIVDVKTGKEKATYHTQNYNRLYFSVSQNGKTAVSSKLQVIDVFSGELLFDLSTEMKDTEKLARQVAPQVTADGRYLVYTIVSEAVVKVARMSDKKMIGICYTHGQPVGFCINKDNIVAVCTYEGVIMLLNIIDIEDSNADKQLESLMQCLLDPSGVMNQDQFVSQSRALRSKKNKSSLCTLV